MVAVKTDELMLFGHPDPESALRLLGTGSGKASGSIKSRKQKEFLLEFFWYCCKWLDGTNLQLVPCPKNKERANIISLTSFLFSQLAGRKPSHHLRLYWS
jgi:hypothetical protein